MLITLLEQSNLTPRFRVQAEARGSLIQACDAAPGLARFLTLGHSEEGLPIEAMIIGRGEKTVSLMAGAHADEPVGPETLRFLGPALLEAAQVNKSYQDLLRRFTFVILPQINPDGEARNTGWSSRWPDLSTCFEHVRELPGRDIEFGYPAMRVENEIVHRLMKQHAPLALHMSLHGMSVAEGCMLLIERHWIHRTQPMRDAWRETVRVLGYELHDHDRNGEKGFIYIEPGFTTTPEGAAMRAYFESMNDPKTASLFHDSSMEAARQLGGDPLCLVTEVPLYVIQGAALEHQPGVPIKYNRYRELKTEWALQAVRGNVPEKAMQDFGLVHVPLLDAMKMQLRAIELGLEAVSD